MGFQIFSGPIHLMRVGITGSSGFLGEALLGALNDASFGVVPIELPRTEVVLDGTFLEQQFSDLDVEAVFNLAAVRHPTNKYEYAVNAQLPILLQKALKRVRPSARFIHMSSINVEIGDYVLSGEKVGEVGSTGRSTGNHLHWGVGIII